MMDLHDPSRVRDDDTIVISNPVVAHELTAMGWNGCFHDNDCACTEDAHENNNRVLDEYVNIYGKKPTKETETTDGNKRTD